MGDLLQGVQNSQMYVVAMIISVVSSDFDCPCLLLSKPPVCVSVCVFIEQSLLSHSLQPRSPSSGTANRMIPAWLGNALGNGCLPPSPVGQDPLASPSLQEEQSHCTAAALSLSLAASYFCSPPHPSSWVVRDSVLFGRLQYTILPCHCSFPSCIFIPKDQDYLSVSL